MNIAEIRAKFPHYNDLNDGQLAKALHDKYYSDMPFRDFGKAIGLSGFEDLNADPTAGMSYGERVAAGAGKGISDLWQGAKQLAGRVDQKEIQETEARDAPLMSQSGAGLGSFLGKVAAPVAAAVVAPAAATYGGAAAIGGTMGLLDPVAHGDVLTGKALNTAIGVAGGVAGQGVGNAIGGALSKYAADKAAKASAAQITNATKDATTQAGQKLGLVVPPTHANPTILNRILEGTAGKLTTAQQAAEKNTAVLDGIAKRALGIPDDVPLSMSAVEGVRKAAGKAYEAVKQVPGKFQADAQYASDLAAVLQRNNTLAAEVPELASKDLGDMVAAFNKPEFTPNGAVEVVKKLRADSRALFKAADNPEKLAEAHVKKGVADAMESMIERNLEQSGNAPLLQALKESRATIAKAHTIEDALNEGSGHVVARKLAAQLAKGKPLSGDLADAARFAQAYPKATQEVTSSMPGISPLDIYGGFATNGAIPAARVLARALMLSKGGQKALTTPNYSPASLAALLKSIPPKIGSAAGLAPLIYGSQQ